MNRLQKVLEGANIKLPSVATDILGKSSRDLLEALVSVMQFAEHLSDRQAAQAVRARIGWK